MKKNIRILYYSLTLLYSSLFLIVEPAYSSGSAFRMSNFFAKEFFMDQFHVFTPKRAFHASLHRNKGEEVDTDKTVRILSIDGGGIRAMLAIRSLQNIMNLVNSSDTEEKHSQVHEVFDLIAGTSSGAITSLALSRPSRIKNMIDSNGGNAVYQANATSNISDLQRLFENNGNDVFKKTFLGNMFVVRGETKSRMRYWSEKGYQFFNPKYSSDGLKNQARAMFGDDTISSALTNVLVPSYQLDRNKLFFFHNFPKISSPNFVPLNLPRDLKLSSSRGGDLWMGRDYAFKPFPDFLMEDVVVAASAAPTYFKPYQLALFTDGDKESMVDAGIFMNNPSLMAYTHAKRIFPSAKRFFMVSLGTGEHELHAALQGSKIVKDLKSGSGGSWAMHFPDILGGGTTEATHQQTAYSMTLDGVNMSKDGVNRNKYFRLNPTLGDKISLDDTSDESIKKMIDAAGLYFMDQAVQRSLEEIVAELCIKERTFPQREDGLPPHDPWFNEEFKKVKSEFNLKHEHNQKKTTK